MAGDGSEKKKKKRWWLPWRLGGEREEALVWIHCWRIILTKKKSYNLVIIPSVRGRLSFSIKFKYMVSLTNKTQTMLFFSRIFEFN